MVNVYKENIACLHWKCTLCVQRKKRKKERENPKIKHMKKCRKTKETHEETKKKREKPKKRVGNRWFFFWVQTHFIHWSMSKNMGIQEISGGLRSHTWRPRDNPTLQLQRCSFIFEGRESNRETHSLAKHAFGKLVKKRRKKKGEKRKKGYRQPEPSSSPVIMIHEHTA